MPAYNTWQRARTREDGWPTRSDIRYDTDAERLCRVLVGLVEEMGASLSLTRAVTLLAQAREAIADHVERVEPVASQPEPATAVRVPLEVEPAKCGHGQTGAHELWLDHEYWDNGHGQSEHAPHCKCRPRACPGPVSGAAPGGAS